VNWAKGGGLRKMERKRRRGREALVGVSGAVGESAELGWEIGVRNHPSTRSFVFVSSFCIQTSSSAIQIPSPLSPDHLLRITLESISCAYLELPRPLIWQE